MKVVFSGGPGAGKTSVLEALQRLGYPVVHESARDVIAGRKARGLSPRPAPEVFAREILALDRQRYREPHPEDATVFFDRSLIDALCLLEQAGKLPVEERGALLEEYRYHPTAFLFPPWREIYCQDAERDQGFGEAVAVFERLHDWYLACGYEVATVPLLAVEERCAFILRQLGPG
ncbi:AAA family ATPase [Parahaliea maris]|uniref:AAA family ATPase n=1 Tax=Parahaliea maris TaxID=2716870 RepID=A0A5C9A3J4_9GAMM|nr:AAA family ATPase [Parahaliea maris]TXS95445.1 AAA family ATPase [Parahaliea maris]